MLANPSSAHAGAYFFIAVVAHETKMHVRGWVVTWCDVVGVGVGVWCERVSFC